MPDPLADDVRSTLLAHARHALRSAAEGAAPPPAPCGGVLDEPAAVFVTLRRGGELRGCVGRTGSDQALGEAVGGATRDAAVADPRFPPVRTSEVPELQIEISRLTPFHRARPEDVEIGRHGVLLRSPTRAGLLLPKVAEEYQCDPRRFLELACRKAGLPSGAWNDPDVALFTFEAEVFGE